MKRVLAIQFRCRVIIPASLRYNVARVGRKRMVLNIQKGEILRVVSKGRCMCYSRVEGPKQLARCYKDNRCNSRTGCLFRRHWSRGGVHVLEPLCDELIRLRLAVSFPSLRRVRGDPTMANFRDEF